MTVTACHCGLLHRGPCPVHPQGRYMAIELPVQALSPAELSARALQLALDRKLITWEQRDELINAAAQELQS